MAKKPTTEFVIYESGLRIGTAPTQAEADSTIRKMVKTLPLGMGYEFEVREQPIVPPANRV